MITSKCGFLDKITHGDLVLADRGFDIAEDLGIRGASLAIPAFTKGKPQLMQLAATIGIISNHYYCCTLHFVHHKYTA